MSRNSERNRKFDRAYSTHNYRYDNRSRGDLAHKEESGETGQNGRNVPRAKPPLLQFTTDINPAIFSGPIPFKVSNYPYRNMNPLINDTSSTNYRSNPDHHSSRRSANIYSETPEEDRRYRRYRDGERDREHGRDRDRTKDRERDRSRERNDRSERERDRERDKERNDRDKERGREREWREEIPNSTIMVRSLDPSVTEADIRTEVTKYGLTIKEVRLIKEKETGASRGFAFVEFQLLSEAVRWKELTKSVVVFNGQHRASLHYSIPKDVMGAERVLFNRADWDCTKCGMSNFRRRDYCFKCNSPRQDTDIRQEGYNEISACPSNTLLFRNLDISTTEERVLAMLGQLTTLPIKSLRVAKDSHTNTSRGFAYVELHSTAEATQLHDLLLSMSGNFYVDGRQVTVSYAKRSLSSMNSAASANAAVVALAAAQWSNQENDDSPSHNSTVSGNSESNSAQDVNESTSSKAEHSSLGSVVIKGVTYKKYSTPDISTYQYDDVSGYYYDPNTKLYYDASSQYYYNSETQQYLYWNAEHKTFLPATGNTRTGTKTDNSAETSSSSPPVQTSENSDADVLDKTKHKKEKADKVKIAKKIAKEMEKWAKTLNQKKENAKLGIVTTTPSDFPFVVPTIHDIPKHSPAADACFAILEKRSSLGDYSPLMGDVLRNKSNSQTLTVSSPTRPVLVASYGDDSDSESETETSEVESKKAIKPAPAPVDDSKFTDWTKLACLLCKRQFASKEALIKHQQLSQLHKTNLAKYSASASR